MTELLHEGVARRSGRYEWGSGANPQQRDRTFLKNTDDLHKQGLSELEIAKAFGMTVNQLRANKTIIKGEAKKADIARALELQSRGMSNVAIGKAMGNRNESSVRDLLKPAAAEKRSIHEATANRLKQEVEDKGGYLDVGEGTEQWVGITRTNMNVGLAMLVEEGYRVDTVKMPQLGTNHDTTYLVLSKPGTTYSDIQANKYNIKTISSYSEDGGRSWLGLEKPTDVDSKRIGIKYAEDGGADSDGVIMLRRGVDDISLGKNKYAQVRIAVDGTHYLKGMAMYSDDMPDGIDLLFNTNKTRDTPMLKVMKPMVRTKAGDIDPDNPFGSAVRQKHYIDANGVSKLSPLNIVGSKDGAGGEEGGWDSWNKSLASQMLSKQSASLAKKQLGLAYDAKQAEYDEIMALTNPTVRKKLLKSFADSADSSAVHLKAAQIPRQRAQVILPINSLKDNEIYAPNFHPGENVVLIRYPHGGIFEIPELVVNNRNPEARRLMANAKDAVGINSKVAARLSGADFDGDTVIVIPNNDRAIKTEKQLEGLKDFDARLMYPEYPGMKPMASKQKAMGDISNLITDMTIMGASKNELARAVKHSMVVIDAEKHNLNYKQSQIDNRIGELKRRYQATPKDDGRGGASTLISQAKSPIRVNERKPRAAKDGGPIDEATGKLMYEYTNADYPERKPRSKANGGPVDKDTGLPVYEETGKRMPRTSKSTKLGETDDAYTLSSGTVIEAHYANYSNQLKALANTARKSYLVTPNLVRDPTAAKVYAPQVQTLTAKLNVALKNSPLERQAQIVGNKVLATKKHDEPDMDAAEVKKIKGQALTEARLRVGAKKTPVNITPLEWEAIQSGAISNNQLAKILENTDLDKIKELAMPRTVATMPSGSMSRAKAMIAGGATQADVASALGVSLTILNESLNKDGA